MRARVDGIARPGNRYRVMLRDVGPGPLRQEIDLVGKAEGLFEIMGDQQNADPLALDQRDHIFDHASAHDRIEGGERLVHQDQPGSHGQHLGERDPLALAATQVAGIPVAEADQIQPLEPDLRLGERFAALHAMEGQAEGHIVARCLPREQGIILEQNAHLRACEIGLDRARERLLQPDDGPQEARLARARRAHETHEAALVDGEARSFEDRFAAVGDRQITDAQLC